MTNHNKRRQLTCPTNIDSETVKIANRMKLVGKLLGRTRLYFTFFIIIFNAQKGCISNTFLLSFGVHDMYIVYALHIQPQDTNTLPTLSTHTLSGLTQAMAMMMATLMKQQTPSDTQNPIWFPPRRNDLRKSVSFCFLFCFCFPPGGTI